MHLQPARKLVTGRERWRMNRSCLRMYQPVAGVGITRRGTMVSDVHPCCRRAGAGRGRELAGSVSTRMGERSSLSQPEKMGRRLYLTINQMAGSPYSMKGILIAEQMVTRQR